MLQKSVSQALVASLMVSLIFSGHYLAAKVVLETVPAQSLAAARGLVGGIILGLIFRKKIHHQLDSRRILVLAAAAALGFYGNQRLLFAGLARTTPVDAALISSTIPIVATLLALALGIDRTDPRRLFGAGLGLGVVGWYLMQLHAVDLGEHAVGNALVLANVLCFCTALLVAKRFLFDLPPVIISASMLTLGGVALWLSGGDLEPVVVYSMSSPSAAALIVFETLITTAVGYTLNLWALQRLSVATTTVFNYLQPPFTAILAWSILGQRPTGAIAIAFVGIIAACILVTSTEQKAVV